MMAARVKKKICAISKTQENEKYREIEKERENRPCWSCRHAHVFVAKRLRSGSVYLVRGAGATPMSTNKVQPVACARAFILVKADEVG